MEFLLSLGADPCLYGRWGRCLGRPSQFARSKGFVKIARTLEQAEAEREGEEDDDDDSEEDSESSEEEEEEERDGKYHTSYLFKKRETNFPHFSIQLLNIPLRRR